MDRFIPYRGTSDVPKVVVVTDNDKGSNPLTLPLCIEQRNWTEASNLLKRSPQEAKTLYAGTNNILPLHAAIAFGAPYYLIEELVSIHPDALRKADHEGKLPIHYAAIFSSKSEQRQVMSCMLKHNPESMWVKDAFERTAIELARNVELQETESSRVRRCLARIGVDDDQRDEGDEISNGRPCRLDCNADIGEINQQSGRRTVHLSFAFSNEEG
jgi:ankyrin repeat protein